MQLLTISQQKAHRSIKWCDGWANKLKIAQAEFQYIVEQDICRPPSSPWSSPLHMVPKKVSDTWRPRGDYRRYQTNTRLPVWKISPANSKAIFSTTDLIWAYYQVPIAEEDISKTTVITPFGLFEFTRMTFGMCSAAQTFQRFTNSAQCTAGVGFVIATLMTFSYQAPIKICNIFRKYSSTPGNILSP